MQPTIFRKLRLLPLLLMALSLPVSATNGIRLIGYGAESTLMGGADTAVARDTSALNTNPAGLVQIKSKQFDAYSSLLRTTHLEQVDARNDQHADNRYTLLAGGGYAQALEELPCTAGIGFLPKAEPGRCLSISTRRLAPMTRCTLCLVSPKSRQAWLAR